jgi:hypothetical protein
MWLNNFPSATGISNQFSPREIILCHRLKYKQHCCTPFGAYCEVHKDNDPTNSMQSQSTPAICLDPTGNLQGTYHFFSLVTGMLIKHCRWTELQVLQSVIDRVGHFAKKSSSPLGLVFADHHCHAFDWTDNDIIGSDKPDMTL